MKFIILNIVLFFILPNLKAQLIINDLSSIRLNTNLNTEFFEKNGYLTYDGNYLLFNRVGDPNNFGGLNDLGDVWYVKKIFENLWSSPVNLTKVNNTNNNLLLGVDHQNNLYVFTNGIIDIYDFSDNNNVKDIGKSVVKYYNSKSSFISGSISSDQNFIVLSIESFGTYGVEDLYFTEKINDTLWAPLKNLGSSINTSYQEISPFLLDDNKTIVFSSNGYDGYGSFDMFSSSRLDETWKNWSEPINLGSKINSEGLEDSFNFNKKLNTIVFSSSKNSIGNSDIKIFSLNKKINDSSEFKDEINTQINNIDDGQRLVLNKVLFHQSSDKLLDESYVQLEMIFNILINNKNLSVFLEGHTDNIGDPNKNLELSNKRVNQVMKYLIDKGIDKNRIEGKGYGSDRPLVKTNSSESRKINRRVEIIFKKTIRY